MDTNVKIIKIFQIEDLDMIISRISNIIANGEKYIQCLFFTKNFDMSDLAATSKHEYNNNSLRKTTAELLSIN